METVVIEICNSKAYKLLDDLEKLEIIKVISKKIQSKQKLSEKYLGNISSETADELQNYISQSRNEWKNQNI